MIGVFMCRIMMGNGRVKLRSRRRLESTLAELNMFTLEEVRLVRRRLGRLVVVGWV
jgi:hypothetical protein